MLRILGGKSKLGRLLQGMLAYAVLQTAAVPAMAVVLAPTAPVQRVAYDGVANRLYFLDNTGALNRLQLTPGCEVARPYCQVSTLVPGGSFKDTTLDVAVNAAAGFGYVTTFGGNLWKVNLNSPAPAVPEQIASGLLIARIVLAPESNSAYVSETRGTLSRVDLSAGQKWVVAQALGGTQSLAVNSARTLAYVGNTGTSGNGTITEIDLATGKHTRTFGDFRFGSAASLAWTDSSESALYALIETAGFSNLMRVDLASSQISLVASFRPTIVDNQIFPYAGSLAVNPSGSGLYLGNHTSVIRFPLGVVPNQRVFLSIGSIPATSISADGYADTSTTPGAPFKVVDSPFGGTLDIFGDLTLLHQYGAASYQITVTRNGVSPPATPVPILASWTTYQWNGLSPGRYEPVLVTPLPDGRYLIPQDYSTPQTAPYLSPTYLMMRWPTSDNGNYTLAIHIFTNATPPLEITRRKIPVDQRSLTVEIDNTPPVTNLTSILDNGITILPCNIVSSGPNAFEFGVEASDPNGHLLSYSLGVVWARNQSATFLSKSYGSYVNADGLHLWKGPGVTVLPLSGDPDWMASCNCAHIFTLRATKRTTNGYGYILSSSSSEAITINNTSHTCP